VNTIGRHNTVADSRPLLVYDGDCGFCGYSVRYWQKLTGGRVIYRPYQEVAGQHPSIPIADFQRAVQFITPDGHRVSAAEATFTTLSHAPGKEFWLGLYRKLPGFAVVAERAYAFVAAHREGFYRVSVVLWGRNPEPPRYDQVSFLFMRLFGLIYLSAFASFGVQAQGLIGSHGILPLAEMVDGIASRLGSERFFLLPMVFWLNDSDFTIAAVCWIGVALSLLLICNVLPRLSLLLLYVLYLSLFLAGQTFTSFQWDTFLLEAGFAALLLSLATTPGVWLLRWLIFRFMFMSGVVKLASGDPNWWNLSALSYHFLTQPLPTPFAWYAAQLPPWLLRLAVAGTFIVELVLPFLIFCPRRLRHIAAFGILLLQCCIIVTGNYNWFNLQTMLLCLLLFDDAAIQKVLPRQVARPLRVRVENKASRPRVTILVSALALLIVFCSVVEMDARLGGSPPAIAQGVDRIVAPLHLTSPYGLFAVMTTARHEIVIEGSNDGVGWREYEFRYKPGDVAGAPHWLIPHQPRLDWQMWFAALTDPQHVYWFPRFLERLLQNEPTVTALLEKNPFPDKPPYYARALYYDYKYADSKDRAEGLWWQRQLLATYFPPVQLASNAPLR
jgi:predicted DCC family thiol-disulfide oxidoreductase YuxK